MKKCCFLILGFFLLGGGTSEARSNNSCTLSITASVVVNVSCCRDSNGSAGVVVNSGNAPFTYSWSTNPVQTNAQATGLKAGIYTITVQDINGCATTASITITQPECLQDSILGSPSLGCNCNGTIEVFEYGGTKPYSYLWSNGRTYDTIHNLTAGEYTVKVCDSTGCCIIDSFPVPAGDPVKLLSQKNVTCYGLCNGSITISTWGWNGFLWSPSGGTGSTASGLCAGTYTLTVTNLDTACSANYVFVITQPPQLIVNCNIISNVSCYGGNNGSASVSVSGGSTPYTYLWSPHGGSSSIAAGLTAGTYTILVKDSNGCSASCSIIITQPLELSVTLSNACPNCCNIWVEFIDATVIGGIPPYTYTWWPNSATGTSVTVSNNCLYNSTVFENVYVTDSKGCNSNYSMYNIVIYYPVQWDPGITQTNVSCYGGNNGSITMNICGQTDYPYYTYYWNSSSAGSFNSSYTASNLSAGTYTVYVSDGNCNTNQIIVIITQPPEIIVTSTVTSNSCNSNGSVTALATAGVSPYTYSWSPTGGTNPAASGLSAGTYTIHVTDNNGCTSSTAAIIGGSVNVTASTSANELCYGGINGSASSTVSGGTSPYTYSWSNSQTIPNITGLSSGTYTLIVTDNYGCTGSSATILTQPNALVVTALVSQTIGCNGGFGTVSSNVVGGTLPYSYSWSGGNGTNLFATVLAGTYTITVKDKNGCISKDSITITQPPVLVVKDSVVSNEKCYSGNSGSAISLAGGGTPPYLYYWSNSATASNVSSLSAGTYTMVVTDSNGCTTWGGITITQPLHLLKDSIQKAIICIGDSATLNDYSTGGNLPYQYLWSTGGTNTSITVAPLVNTKYVLIVTDSNGCVVKDSSMVKVNPLPVVTLIIPSKDSVCYDAGDIILFTGPTGGTLSGSAVYGSLFYPDSAKTGAFNLITYSYTDSNGCSSSITDSIYVETCTGINEHNGNSIELNVLPNPNNGIFTMQLTGVGTQNFVSEVEIYDVLGQKIFTETLRETQGDNLINLTRQPNGVYFYRALSEGTPFGKEDGGLIGEGKIILAK